MSRWTGPAVRPPRRPPRSRRPVLHVPVVLRLLLVALVLTATAAAGVGAPVTAARAATATSWPMAGGDAANSRANAAETLLSPATAGGLQRQWSAPLGATHAATPAVVDGTVYVPDAAGSMLALDAATGQTRWSRTIASYTGVAGDTSRASPAVVDGRVVFGTRRVGTGAKVVAARASDGAPLWVRVVDTHRAARITGAPVVAGGVVYVGVSSDEEVATTCCTWRGSVVALDAATGAVLWRTMTVPEGYTGGAVWSSTPVVNAAAGLLYVTTGNNYTVPAGVCSAPGQTGCSAGDPRNYVDAVLALRLVDGSPAWALRTMSADVWTKACRVPGAPPCGPDFDFGAGANLFTATIGGVARQLVGAGQKSGIYWAVDAVTGELVWQRRVGPGGDLGGIQWGTAADGRRIYVAVANSENAPYQLPSGRRSPAAPTPPWTPPPAPSCGRPRTRRARRPRVSSPPRTASSTPGARRWRTPACTPSTPPPGASSGPTPPVAR